MSNLPNKNMYIYFRNAIIYLFVTTIFLHFLKSSTPLYYVILLGLFFLLLFLTLLNKNFLSIYTDNTFIFLIFVFYLIFSAIWSFTTIGILFNGSNVGIIDIIIGIGNMLIIPLSLFFILNLAEKKETIINIILIFIMFVCLGALSMILQYFVGDIRLFGEGYARFGGYSRYGEVGLSYSSILGAPTVYGSVFFLPLILCFTYFKKNILLNFLIILILIAGLYLSTSKAGILNLLITLLLLIIFLNFKQKILLIVFMLLASIMIVYFLPEIFSSGIVIFSNTFGIDIGDVEYSRGLYSPILEKGIQRFTGYPWINNSPQYSEFLFGFGVIGPGGIFGTNFRASSHNAILDLYQIGGIFLPIIFILLYLSTQYYLLKFYLFSKDQMSLSLFICNIPFLINMFVHAGAIFHPYVSFIFYLSIIYVSTHQKIVIKKYKAL